MNLPSRARRLKSSLEELGDFTTTVRVIPISLMAIVIGGLGACVAWLLLKTIGIFTNIALLSSAQCRVCFAGR